jgi:porin
MYGGKVMRIFNLFVLVFLLGASSVLAQNLDSTKLKDAFSVNLKYTADGVYLKDKFYYMGDISFITEFSTEKANLWKGGNFKLYVLHNHGQNPSADLGALQNISGIEAANQTHLYELSYEQSFDNLALLLGMYVPNNDFACSRFAGNYVNSSFGITPELSSNAPAATFPVSTFGLRLKWDISPNLTFLTCLNQGDGGDDQTNPYGLKHGLFESNGLLSMNELQYRYFKDSVEMTTLKAGTWFLHPSHDSGEMNIHGFYAIAEQMLVPKGEDKGLGIFLQVGYTPASMAMINSYYGAGILYSGFSKKRSEDCFGISFANANINQKYKEIDENLTANSELFIEGMYRAKFGEYVSVQPCLQYCINAGGIKDENHVIGLCKLIFDF